MLAAAASTDIITLDPFLLSLLIGVVIPLVTGLVTKASLDTRIKALIALALAAVGGVLVQVNNAGGTFDWKQSLVAVGVTFGTSVVSYLGFHQPVLDVNNTLAPNFGIGPANPQV